MPERKSTMVSVRLPATFVARIDYAARNTIGEAKDRSKALREALEQWLSRQEKELEQLGVIQKKAR